MDHIRKMFKLCISHKLLYDPAGLLLVLAGHKSLSL